MRTISQLLDLAKKKNKLPSDLQLARKLDMTNIAQYRTKGVISSDETAIKLADLCGLPAEEVMITCHLLKAQSGEHPGVKDTWKKILKMAANACIGLSFLVGSIIVTAPSKADASVHSARNDNIHYATFAILTILSLIWGTSTFYRLP